VPIGACHFRKVFELTDPVEGRITIGADDSYELYVNGRLVGRGTSSKKLDDYDITRFLDRGTNTIAVKVVNQRGSTAGLAARVMIRDSDQQWRTFSTDPSWRTNLRPLPLWNTSLYNDRRWDAARSLGPLGDTVPFDRQPNVARDQRERSERFSVADEFEGRRIGVDEKTGWTITMTFNEHGRTLAGREGGPLLRICPERGGRNWSVRTYCEDVKD